MINSDQLHHSSNNRTFGTLRLAVLLHVVDTRDLVQIPVGIFALLLARFLGDFHLTLGLLVPRLSNGSITPDKWRDY